MLDPLVVRVLASLLCAAALAPAAAAAPPPSPKDAGDPKLPARIETLVVRDILQGDGRSDQLIEASVFLNDAVGVSQFGQIGMPYIEGYGQVTFEKVEVEKPDGQRVDARDAVTEDINPFGMSALPVPADFRIRRLTVPGLAAGDRLHYRMMVRHKPLFPGAIFGQYRLVRAPGVAEQVYEVDAPADLRLSFWARPDLGAQWEDRPSAAGRRVRRLTVKAPLAMPEGDPAAQAAALGEPDVLFTSFRSWDELAHWWWALSRDRFLPDQSVRTEASRLVAGRDDVVSRIAGLHAFVSGEVRYLNVGLGSGRYQPRPAAEVLSTRYADCKGKHALLAALGSASGVEVWPVLIHSSRQDLHDDVPAPVQFDHLISVVRRGDDPSQWLWIDSTNEFAPAGHLPPNLRGKRALLVDDKGGRVVTIPERLPFPTRVTVDSRGTLDAAGPLRAHVRLTARDDTEPLLRAAIRLAPRDKWIELGKSLAKEWSRGVVTEVTAGEPMDLQQPFWIEYAVEHKMTAKTFEKDWTLWIPLPDMGLPKPTEPKEGKPAAALDMGDEVVHRARVEVPEGMKVRAPLSVTLDRPFASYRSTYSIEGRTLIIERVLQVRQRKITTDQLAAYEAFRSAIRGDRRQEFPIEAFRSTAAEALETADALNDAGKAALDSRRDAELAAALLRRAVEKDPKHKWAWNNLGRALRKLKKPDEALKAFERQIEIDPFDPWAYHNRGATLLFDLNRREEAEKDFLKQVEVAPLEVYAYRDLAHLRTLQERFPEAAELLERAAAARPSDEDVWLRLAWARARVAQGDTAAAVRRARALDDSPRTAIIGARALAVAGDLGTAATVAKEALPRLLASLDADDRARLDDERGERDLLYVAEAWRLIGAAALKAGDLETAERYLGASWQLGSTPDTAVDFGRLRERQGRASEALSVWQQGSFLPAWRGNPAKKELERIVSDTAERAALLEKASQEMAKWQVQKLSGASPASAVEVRVRLLVDERGRVLEVGPVKTSDAAKLQPLRDRVVSAKFPALNPDNSKFKLVRGGTLNCHPQAGCSLGLNLYGDEVAAVLER